ncbi:MAG: SDR family NAD(P)-dependent oxidoreductase [Jatrophihabitans sp.]
MIANQPLLAGKTVLVTGSSRGIGAATARALGRHGAAVIVNYVRNAEAAKQVVADIEALGSRAIAVQADVRRPAEVEALVERTRQELGEIDVLICNAIGDTERMGAKLGRSAPCFVDSAAGIAELRETVNSQLDATLSCCRYVVPSMRRAGGGSIVFIGSSITHNSAPAAAEITVAKSAQDGLARVLAQQLGPDNIRVNNVAPGFVPTDANAGLHQQSIIEHFAIQTPLTPLVGVEDVANAVVSLVTDLSGRLTGLFIPVDGGLTVM